MDIGSGEEMDDSRLLILNGMEKDMPFRQIKPQQLEYFNCQSST
jgi:hypothetical protein